MEVCLENYQFWLPLALTAIIGAIGAYGTYLQKKQLQLMLRAKGKKGVAPSPGFWRSNGQLVVMFVCAAIAWVPYVISRDQPQPTTLQYMLKWGPVAPPGVDENANSIPVGLLKYVKVVARGHELLPYKDKYRVGAVSFHYLGTTDVDDVDNLQKSNLYDIRDDAIELYIPVNEAFRQEIAHGGSGHTNYHLLVVPKERSMGDFTTMRQAKALGAKVVSIGSGSP